MPAVQQPTAAAQSAQSHVPSPTPRRSERSAPQQSAATARQQAAPQQNVTTPQQPIAPQQSAAFVQQPQQWSQQMTRAQQPSGSTMHHQQMQPSVGSVPPAQQALHHTIPSQQAQTSTQPHQMPRPQQPLGFMQPQQMQSAQQPYGNAAHPQQAGFIPPPSLNNTIPPQQPARGWENAGQPGFYGQPQTAWQQPYYGQQESNDVPQPVVMPDGRAQRMPDYPSEQTAVGFPWKAVVAALALLALLIAGIFGIRAAVRQSNTINYVSAYDTRFCEGVYVDGIHLGGMTQQEGIEAVTQQAQRRISDWYVRLTYQGRTVVEMNASALGMRVDVADALKRAWDQGHSSSDVSDRKAAMEQLLEEPYHDYTVLPSGDTSIVDSVLEELRSKVYRAPQDAYLAEFDPAKTYPFTIQDEVMGMMLNTDSLKEQIYQMVATMQSGELEIEPDSIAPNVTAAQIRASVALRADEYTEISTTSTDDRNRNISRAFEKISGTIVKPGDIFSFNAVVGRRTTANGFFPAVEYNYGKEEMGIGGGVCQASTSLYLAAVAANLQITKHTPHAMQVGYTTFGKDATVSWEGDRQIDFAFRNNTDGNIYIVASVQYDRTISKYSIARVRIYGPSLGDGVTYKLEAEEIEFIPRTEEIRKDTKGEHPELVYTDDQLVVSEGRDGHVTQSYRVKYQNGVAVERTAMFTDTYKASPRVIYTGTLERWDY